MKQKKLRSIMLGGSLLLACTAAQAQVTTNSGSGLAPSYPSLASAVTALNSATVTSPVIITLTGAETAPAGGYSITATGTAGNTITIDGGGLTVTAGVQAANSFTDAIFKVIGGDYITIQNFTMQENAANTVVAPATNTMTEWGVALLYATATNNAQNCTIQNNVISLNRTYQNSTGVYANATHTATSVTVTASATGAGGGNSGMKVYGNNISNVAYGITVVGPTAAADANTGIDIGGTVPATGNTVTNYGLAGAVTFNNVSATVNGILVRNAAGANISYNTVTASPLNTGSTLNGILVQASSNTPTATFTNTVNSNNISLKSATVSSTITGISYPSGSASATSTLNVNNNDFNNFGHTGAGTGSIGFINVASTNQFTTINGNTFTNISVNTTAGVTFIAQSFTAPATGTKAVNNNSIVTAFSKTGAGGTVTFILDNGSTVSGAVSNCIGNTFSNGTLTGATSITGISYTDGGTAPTRTVTGNTINNWTTGAATANMMNFTYWNGSSSVLSGNTVSNISAQGAITGLTIGSSASTANPATVTGNTFFNFSSSGAGGAVSGITCSNTSPVFNITANTIYGLSSTGSTVTGILISAATLTNVSRNNIYNLLSTNANPVVTGISLTAGTTTNVFNNFVSDLRATAANAAAPLFGINASGGTNANILYNTVVLGNAGSLTSSGAIFGGTGVGYSTGVKVTLQNNIISVSGITNGTGIFSAVRRNSNGTQGTAPSNTTSFIANNNIYYVNAAANNALYIEGNVAGTATNGYAVSGASATNIINDAAFNSSCSLYKTFMGTGREQATFTENNLTAGSTVGTFLPSGASFAESNAIATTPVVTTDFAGTTRTNPSDVGALEFSGTATDAIGPVVAFTNISNSYCVIPPMLSATITDASGINAATGTKPRLYYKLSTEANAYSATNTSADNGWKYVEASNSSSPFSFTPDYSLLTSVPTNGSTIQYFVIAQDLAATPNVGNLQASYAGGFCASSVALPGAAFPLGAAPVIKSYNVNAIPTLTVTAAPAAICVSGTTTLTFTGYVADPNISILWESSTNGGATFTAIAGATAATYTTPVLTAANTGVQYRASITCSGSAIATSPAVTIAVNDPMVASTTPGSRCGPGTVVLGATGSSGTTLNWYAGATGGTLLGSGTTFTTPSISTNTPYYVEAVAAGGSTIAGPASPTAEGGTIGTQTVQWDVNFTVLAATTLSSVTIFPVTSGQSGTITVRNGTGIGGTVLSTINYTTSVSGGSTPQVIPINFALGTGNYSLYTDVLPSSGISRNTTLASYPYTTSVAKITGNGYDPNYYMGLYNWTFGTSCNSARTSVAATVTPAPAITVTPATSSVCGPTAVTLNASSSNAGYTYTFNPGNLSGASQTVTPVATTTYTVSAVDAVSGCNTTGTATVTVNPAAPVVTVSPTATTINCGDPATLVTASAAALTGSATVSSGAISLSIPDASSTGVGSPLALAGIPAGATIDSVVAKFSATHGYDQDIVINLQAPNGQIINLVNGLTVTGGVSFTNTRITSDNTAAGIPATGAPFTGTYKAAATTTGFQLTPAPVPTTNTFSNLFTTPNGTWTLRAYDDESIGTGTLTAWSLQVYYTLPTSIAWSSTAGLYTDAAGTIPYTGTPATSVYAKPSNTITYTATATLGGCTSTATSAFTVNGSSTTLVPSTDLNTATLGGTTDYRNANCQLIATVAPSGSSPVAGNVTSKAYVAGSTQTYNGQPYVGRSYEITPAVNAATATADVTLYFTQAELDAYNTTVGGTFPLLPTGPLDAAGIANSRITQYHGVNTNPYAGTPVAGQNLIITPASMSWDATNSWWAVTFPVTGFSGFVLHTTNTMTPLPIVLKAISAKAVGATNRVEWSTSVETSIGSYIVERSDDGHSFSPVATVSANNRPSEYSIVDANPVQGINYYRLHIMELSGQSSYSRIVTATQGRSTVVEMNAYPNPATDKLVIDVAGASADATLSLKDLNGRTLMTQRVQNGTAVFQIATLPAGTYFAVYAGENGTKVVKVNKL